MTTTPDAPAAKPDIAERFDTGGWKFTPEVVEVFPEHVRASVPHYDHIQALIAEVADWHLPPGGVFADLGASTGATAELILDRHPGRDLDLHLYDVEKPMLDRAKATLNPKLAGKSNRVWYHHQNILEPLQHQDADLTTCVFVLQFMPLRNRRTALQVAREHAADTGTLIVAEKIRPADARWAEIANDRSHDWKADHGITADAIRAKARALRGVLTPHPLATVHQLITETGWRQPEVLFCWHSWAVIGAFAA